MSEAFPEPRDSFCSGKDLGFMARLSSPLFSCRCLFAMKKSRSAKLESKGLTGLGRSLAKSKNVSRQKQQDALRKARQADRRQNYGVGGFTSVTEINSLDDFIVSAEMADREFAVERQNVVVVAGSKHVQRAEDDRKGEKLEHLTVPRRPEWHKGMTAEELDTQENAAFIEWRRSVALLEENTAGKAVTPFEKNLEFWRQLWRVVERSDLVVQIIDARNPLLFRCPDVETYTKEHDGGIKENMLILNKADFLTPALRVAWRAYFDKLGVQTVFFSAKAEQARLDALFKKTGKTEEEQEEGEEGKKNDSKNDDAAAAAADDDDDDVEAAAAAATALQKDAALRGEDVALLSRHELVALISAESERIAVRRRELQRARLAAGEMSEEAFGHAHKAVVGMVGYPNVGKSSIINVLMGTTAQAHGTTRVRAFAPQRLRSPPTIFITVVIIN